MLCYTRGNQKVKAIFKLRGNRAREELAHCAVLTMPVEHNAQLVLRIPQWTLYLLNGSDSLLQLQHYTTHGDHTTQSSAPDDGNGTA